MDRINEEWRTRKSQERDIDREYIEDIGTIQAYADDQVIIIGGKSSREIEQKWKEIWGGCSEWEEHSGVKYNKEKMEIMFISKGRKIRPPTIKIEGQTITHGETIKYLGLNIDRGMTFLKHTKEMNRKIEQISNKIIGLITRTYGHDKQNFKCIAENVIRPAALYASEIWGINAGREANKRQIEAAQRPLLLLINRTYRTTSTAALQVLAGISPWWIEAEQKHIHWNENLEDMYKTRVKTKDRAHPATYLITKNEDNLEQRHREIIYVDASCNGGKTGIGICYGDKRVSIRTSDGMDIHTAEQLAVKMALEDRGVRAMDNIKQIEVRNGEGKDTYIIWRKGKHYGTDEEAIAHELARQATKRRTIDVENRQYTYKTRQQMKAENYGRLMERWQRTWDNGSNGKELYKHCRQVGNEIIQLNFKASQLMTGHGNMESYKKRFKLKETTGKCGCNRNEEEDATHIRQHCTFDFRQTARENIEKKYGDLMVQLRKDGRKKMTQTYRRLMSGQMK
ncbi:uncharacterized protein LOC123685277 [Harmonia axyridis]|uniref:uncharacterized protein LOC123685277 n=1 Tax=Harmonia axyridis TaxID=115357 RepID=UPI001E277604|nr:uncharacterized protein LOC123685277 [Harmonia axyridis]